MGSRPLLLLSCVVAVLVSLAQARVVEHTFNVGNLTVRRLCKNHVVTAVNGRLPGPTIHAHEGDTAVVHVVNDSPYDVTIHWHGIFQLLSAWADGPSYITQCPIAPGSSYTYRFSIIGQEGTLWWHAHFSMLRATVYGALIIKPRNGVKAYPFPKPYKEVPILLGEWWDANVVDVDREAIAAGVSPNISDAFTINGRPGDLYRCSNKHTYKLQVEQGKTYLLRIINAALDNQFFFKVAGHTLKVVAADASYTVPYTTDVVVAAPGQTIDALMVADAPAGHYYMAAHAYFSLGIPGALFPNTTTTGIVRYKSAPLPAGPPLMPILPAFSDIKTAMRFYAGLKALIPPGRLSAVPYHVDKRMFVTVSANVAACGPNQPKCQKFALAASMNNVSFAFPTKMSLLEAHFKGVKGVYTADFPNRPPRVFNFSNTSLSSNLGLAFTAKSTTLKRLKYNATVEIILQNTVLIGIESHPIHLHGFNFFVLAQGLGNYNAATARKRYNLVNPQERNTIAVPPGGWAVIRFKANNPGVWFMHCHLDVHLSWGLGMAFEVENGPDESSTLPPPPPDFPSCKKRMNVS